MQIRNYLALIITFVSAYSFAADNMQMFNSKSECLRSFTISSGTSDVVAGENYCKNRVVKSAVELCADKKLLEFKMKNSISSVQEQQYLFKFKTECTQASLSAATGGQQSQQSTQLSERDAQISAQQAAMNTQQQAALAAATAQKNQAAALAQQKEDAARQVALTKALVPVLNQVASDYDKQAAIEAKEAREAAGKSAPAEKPAVATAAAPAKESPPEAAPPVAAPVAAQADAAPADGVLTEGVYKDAAGHSYQVVDNLSEPSKPLIMKTDAKTGAQTEVADPRTDGVPLTSDGAEVVRDVGTGLSEPIAEATKAAAIPSSRLLR